MTALSTPTARAARRVTRPARLRTALRAELVKLVSQRRIWVLLALCWVAPGLFVVAVAGQSSLPADTVFGRWMHTSGWAGPLVVLTFSCAWVLPLLTALVSGDVFAAEDRLDTWRFLMLAVRSPRRIFVSKTLASLLVVLAMTAGLAVSSTAGGLLAVGSHPLTGLDGQVVDPATCARLVLVAWAYVAVVTLVYAAVGILGSVTLGRSPLGLLAPLVLAFTLQLAQLLPLPVSVRLALPSQAFLAWRGLFTAPTQPGPLWLGLLVAFVWVVVALSCAFRSFQRRDFGDLGYDGSTSRAVVGGVLPLAAATALTAVALSSVVPAGTGLSRSQVDQAVATSFGHLYRLQAKDLQRPDITEAELRSRAACHRGVEGSGGHGPGSDWRCVVTWRLPHAVAVGTAFYQLEVSPDGRIVADGDGPNVVNGFFVVHTPDGDQPNPLFQVDTLVDLSSRSATKG